jgi:peptide/nickel transport system ATP-binding protein
LHLLDIRELRTYFYTDEGTVKAVDDVSFTVDEGEAVGLAGESGSGKTTIALSIMRLIKPPGKVTSGQILYKGEDLLTKTATQFDQVRWKEISMIFQGAMNALNPVYTVGNQIVEAILHHEETTTTEAWKTAERLLGLVGIDQSRARNFPHEFSGGMRQRAMIAMSLALNPGLVIADEPTTALDVIVERQIIDLIADLKRKLGLSILLITHDLSVISELCTKVAIFYAGQIAELSPVDDVLKEPLHPYTRGLLDAFLRVEGPKKKLQPIMGNPPNLLNPPTGCRFHPRCPFAMDICAVEEPKPTKVGERIVVCHLFTERSK